MSAFIVIRLHGALAKRFGKEFRCVASSVSQAIRFLSVNFPDFDRWVLAAQERGIYFKVKTNGYEIGEDELTDLLPEDFTIHIIPLFLASGGSNLLKIVAGVALIGLGVFTGGFLGLSGLQLVITGSLLLISGLMGGRTDKADENTDSEKSFIFSGSSNTSAAGGRVSVVYGKIQTGSTILSAAVRSYQTA